MVWQNSRSRESCPICIFLRFFTSKFHLKFYMVYVPIWKNIIFLIDLFTIFYAFMVFFWKYETYILISGSQVKIFTRRAFKITYPNINSFELLIIFICFQAESTEKSSSDLVKQQNQAIVSRLDQITNKLEKVNCFWNLECFPISKNLKNVVQFFFFYSDRN